MSENTDIFLLPLQRSAHGQKSVFVAEHIAKYARFHAQMTIVQNKRKIARQKDCRPNLPKISARPRIETGYVHGVQPRLFRKRNRILNGLFVRFPHRFRIVWRIKILILHFSLSLLLDIFFYVPYNNDTTKADEKQVFIR